MEDDVDGADNEADDAMGSMELLSLCGQSAIRCSVDLHWWHRLGRGPCGHLAAMWLAKSPQL